MLLFSIKLYFLALCLAIPSLRADDASLDYAETSDQSTTDQAQIPSDEPTMPDPTQATPLAAPAPTVPAATATPDTSVPNSQLKWPDTSELQEAQTNIVPASATSVINVIYDKTKQALTSMDTTIAEMLDKRKSLYSDFFTLNTTTDDFMQDQQIAIGSLIELFNPSDKKKE